ncbi:MAG TPA: DUF4097 family beta strand repeat-containing protein [Terracidiphilus sp.]|jgi:hypothetical protein|nr:DUF4097 family beta strand repeat-containing protein [Terracidiphilus sp.]
MKWIMAAVSIGLTVLSLAAPARGAEATFARDLAVNGRVQLIVANGSGTIHLIPSAEGHISIHARVRSNWGGSDADVNEITAHPPIQQTGNIVRIGERHEHRRNISIDYEIEAPADSYLDVATGSGSIRDDGVGSGSRLNTGSGSIHATGLKDWYSVSTGSGSIYVEGSGNGDVTASTGSGTIELHGLHGALRASTGSGSIKAEGVPQGPWHLDTGSGGVELETGGAPFTLDASTGSGGIRCDREMTGQTNTGKHRLSGRIEGGGPLVRIKTGSGSIRID